MGADGKPLNFDFETGTLKDWTAEGQAFTGQPIADDTINQRRPRLHSQHQGRFWIGTFERLGDAPQGTLTSVPFKVTHPWCSFLIGGGGPHPTTCVELALQSSGEIFSRTSGINGEPMWRVAIDLQPHLGQMIFIRLVDHWSGPWGHLNFDDFRFHSRPPNVPPRPARRLSPEAQLLNPSFESGLIGWAPVFFGARPVVVVDPKVAHAGRASLRISAAKAADVTLAQEVRLTPGQRYRLSGWVRTHHLDPHRASVFGTLQIQQPGGQGIIARGDNHSGTKDWTLVQIPFVAPSGGVVRIVIFFVGFGRGTGTAWFDDLKLEAMDAQP